LYQKVTECSVFNINLIEIREFFVSFFIFISGNTLTSYNSLLRVMSGFLSTMNPSMMRLYQFLRYFKSNTCQELLSDWSIYLNVLHTVGQSNMNGGLSWPWSYGSWIYNYLCNQCLSPLMLWVRIWRARCTTLYDKVCQWLVTGFLRVLQFPLPIITDHHNIIKILLKVALNTIKPN
jgi:hypothetical protein